MTPEYLVQIGLLDKAPDASRDIGLLLGRALEKIAFLPFGLVIDQWRWDVFGGDVRPGDYNKAWWDRRLKYQGIVPPSPRGEEFFDPGAKYHVAANYSYRCSIYGNKAAGARLEAMLKMGASKPWPDALEALTGSRQMDATAILDYFKPLQTWLDEQTKGKPRGW